MMNNAAFSSNKRESFERTDLNYVLEAVVMTSVSRPTRYLSILSSPVTNMSIGSPFIHPPQMPSEIILTMLTIWNDKSSSSAGDYARQVLDHALADLMECSM